MVTVPVGVTVTPGVVFKQVILVVAADNVTDGAFEFATMRAVAAGAEQPLVPVATTEYVPGPEIVALVEVTPLKIEPETGAVHVYVVPPVVVTTNCVVGVAHDKVKLEGVTETEVGTEVLVIAEILTVPVQPLVVSVTVAV